MVAVSLVMLHRGLGLTHLALVSIACGSRPAGGIYGSRGRFDIVLACSLVILLRGTAFLHDHVAKELYGARRDLLVRLHCWPMLMSVDEFSEFQLDVIARVQLLPILEHLLEVFLVGLGSDPPETRSHEFIFLLEFGAL